MKLKEPILVFTNVSPVIVRDWPVKFVLWEVTALLLTTGRALSLRELGHPRVLGVLLLLPLVIVFMCFKYKHIVIDEFPDLEVENRDLPVFSKTNQDYMKLLVPLYGGSYYETDDM
jgi:hypothetical protein